MFPPPPIVIKLPLCTTALPRMSIKRTHRMESYYSEFRVQGWKNAQPLQTATHFSSDESWVWTFKCLHNIIALNDVRQPHRARKNALSRCALKKRKKDQVKRENEKGGGDCIMSERFRLVRNLFLHALASLKYTRPQLRCPVRNIPLITLLTY